MYMKSIPSVEQPVTISIWQVTTPHPYWSVVADLWNFFQEGGILLVITQGYAQAHIVGSFWFY